MEQLPPFEVVFIRTAIAAVGLLLTVYARGLRMPNNWDGIRPLVILGVGDTVIPFALITWGEQSIDGVLAAVIQASAALFTLIVAHFSFEDRTHYREENRRIGNWFPGGGGAGKPKLAGRPDCDRKSVGTTGNCGRAVFYAFGGVYSRKVVSGRLEPFVVAAGAMTTAAIVTGVLMMITPLFGGVAPVAPADMQTNVLVSSIALGLFNTWLAYMIFCTMIGTLGAAKPSMVTYIVPAVD